MRRQGTERERGGEMEKERGKDGEGERERWRSREGVLMK